MTSDDLITWGFIAEVLGALEDHRYFPGSNPYPGQAKGLIADLTRIYHDLQHAPAAAYRAEVPSAPQAAGGPPGTEADDDAVVLSAGEVRTIVAALNEAADYKRDRVAACADCADQSCGTCQWRLQAADTYGQLALQLIQTAEAARTAGGRHPEPDSATVTGSQPQVAADREAGQ